MSNEARRHGGSFALVPEWLLDRASGNAIRVWCLLWMYSGNASHHAWPSHETLAARMGMSIGTSRRALEELTQLGCLTVERRTGASNLYWLHWFTPNGEKLPTSEQTTLYTRVQPPCTPVSNEERQSEIENHSDNNLPTSEQLSEHKWALQEPKLSREQIRELVAAAKRAKSAFCPTCREKLSRCLCDSVGSGNVEDATWGA